MDVTQDDDSGQPDQIDHAPQRDSVNEVKNPEIARAQSMLHHYAAWAHNCQAKSSQASNAIQADH